jgi:plasmid stabilization system protein ParE
MPRLIWSRQALLDVQRLYCFLAAKNSEAAKRAIQSVRQGVKVLGRQPGIGRPIEDLPNAFREWLIDFGDSGYVVRYRVDADAEVVMILAVRHQKEAGF